ncbi:MAG TPA: hypothetical protein VMW10_09390 [Alphaproteobacteria bacterium]|nr:hypothetical protein [Alphaproteobacteria bacterium]
MEFIVDIQVSSNKVESSFDHLLSCSHLVPPENILSTLTSVPPVHSPRDQDVGGVIPIVLGATRLAIRHSRKTQ